MKPKDYVTSNNALWNIGFISVFNVSNTLEYNEKILVMTMSSKPLNNHGL